MILIANQRAPLARGYQDNKSQAENESRISGSVLCWLFTEMVRDVIVCVVLVLVRVSEGIRCLSQSGDPVDW